MHAMFGKMAMSGLTLALGALTLAPGEAQAGNCYWTQQGVLASGVTPTEVSRDNGASWALAYSVPADPVYSVIPGTSYINYNPTLEGVLQSWATYRTTFEVPVPDAPRDVYHSYIQLRVHADNVAYAYLDGARFFQHAFVEDTAHFQGAPETAQVYLEPGTHTLSFDVFNFGQITGLDYAVTLHQYVCEPCPRPWEEICTTSSPR